MASKLRQTTDVGLPFPVLPSARASSRRGTVYAIGGGDSQIYYGQIAADKSVGFFRYRSEKLDSIEEVLASELMSRFYVGSIGDALRAGRWLKLGVGELRQELAEDPLTVMWSIGSTQVEVWKGRDVVKTVTRHDPEIQDLEIMAVYDATFHAPKRLVADYRGGFDSWSVGGPVWRERVKMEEAARTHPELPWHVLPEDWVPVERSGET